MHMHITCTKLLMRTFFKDYGLPRASDDWAAHAFRRELLPKEDAYLKRRSA